MQKWYYYLNPFTFYVFLQKDGTYTVIWVFGNSSDSKDAFPDPKSAIEWCYGFMREKLQSLSAEIERDALNEDYATE